MPSGLHAFFAGDPGRTTGVAGCYVQFKGTLKETLLTATNKKAIELKGPWLEQGRTLGHLMDRFVYRANVEALIPLDNIHLVMEDFVLRRRREGGATGDLTSIWVAAAANAFYAAAPDNNGIAAAHLGVVPVVWQQPSEGKFVDNVKLKAYGLYEVGSEHKRDAWRHIATRVDKLLP